MTDKQTTTEKKLTGKEIILYSMCVLFLGGFFAYFTAPSKPISPEETRKELIKKEFNAWDGSHFQLEEYIKKSMNDPGSYEHVETVYWDRGDYLVVMTTFRGKNAFGGVVKNSVKAKVGLDGSIIDIIETR